MSSRNRSREIREILEVSRAGRAVSEETIGTASTDIKQTDRRELLISNELDFKTIDSLPFFPA
jgi:hypothetical protein